jgi:hypothetical protein
MCERGADKLCLANSLKYEDVMVRGKPVSLWNVNTYLANMDSLN